MYISIATNAIDNAINEGHSISWAADVSERGFSWKNGLAIVPETDIEEMSGSERLKWEAMTDAERKKQMFSFETPMPEKAITQEIRQEGLREEGRRCRQEQLGRHRRRARCRFRSQVSRQAVRK